MSTKAEEDKAKEAEMEMQERMDNKTENNER